MNIPLDLPGFRLDRAILAAVRRKPGATRKEVLDNIVDYSLVNHGAWAAYRIPWRVYLRVLLFPDRTQTPETQLATLAKALNYDFSYSRDFGRLVREELITCTATGKFTIPSKVFPKGSGFVVRGRTRREYNLTADGQRLLDQHLPENGFGSSLAAT